MSPRRDNGRRGGRPPGRRPPPPPATGEEQRWFESARRGNRAVVVRLADGSELRGRIRSHDRESFALLPEDGKEVVIRKADVRTIAEG